MAVFHKGSYSMNTSFLSPHLQQVLVSVYGQIQSPKPLIMNSNVNGSFYSNAGFLGCRTAHWHSNPNIVVPTYHCGLCERKTTTDKIFSKAFIHDFEHNMLKVMINYWLNMKESGYCGS